MNTRIHKQGAGMSSSREYRHFTILKHGPAVGDTVEFDICVEGI
jgi:hypothetical protein